MAQRTNRAFSHDVKTNPVGVELFNWAACGEPSSKKCPRFFHRGGIRTKLRNVLLVDSVL